MHGTIRKTTALAVLAVVTLAPDLASGKITEQCGKASWYEFTGKTASGEAADPNSLTAAHPSLPFGTRVKVENLKNGRTVEVRINDRGPHVGGRIIDLSRKAAEKIGLIDTGVGHVRIAATEATTPKASCHQP